MSIIGKSELVWNFYCLDRIQLLEKGGETFLEDVIGRAKVKCVSHLKFFGGDEVKERKN